ncbi:hypothetical protein CONCODRAFT_11705 [Conidiobolus coronatus NRRL 28638]|uniref:G-protein coupled receptors family 1 profile domain-containing protein n=1 Tax=Conidiobolus coronatus (strain ATCC 28846 / CBS 209.66 / NRRL 28638) TaxID=796925 RepID=A0A137NUJ8_CONC2|nr:hypothetical protein CONCODRAFT_11705 [Conidiobolus coronatus NRRL 28638]|eukprot:KXN66450.1 hypothetical protein CONCODRAFT_11705 [Conidiobolus coronatus NRRL 28638]
MLVSTIFAYIGLACSSILILTWLTMAIVDLKSVSRVTIRLVAGIAIADFLNHISSILGLGTKKYLGTPYCESLAAVITLDHHLYAFTNIAISYHLYRVIVKLKKPSFKSELAVWIILLVVISAFMITYHFIGVFSGTENKKSCNPGANNPAITKTVFGLFGLFNLLAIFSGLFVTVKAHKNLGLWIESFSNKEFLDPKDQEEFKAVKRKETQRSFLYPLSAVITLSSEVILCAWMVVGNPPLIMFTINSNMMGFKGILTLFAFLIDPMVQAALKHTYSKLMNKKTEDIELSIK